MTDYYKIDRMSNSRLASFARSPRHYLYERNYPKEPTEAMIFGNVFHTLVLEPDKFSKRYALIDESAPKKPTSAQWNAKKPSPESIAAMDWWRNFNELNFGKTIISQSDYITAGRMSEAIFDDKFAYELMHGIGEVEKSLEWDDDVTGVPMKMKMDGYNEDYTIDLKSCVNADPRVFAKTAFDSYLTQPAVYVDGRGANKLKKGEFYFIAVEKSEPFGVSVLKCDKEFIQHGRYVYGQILDNYRYWCEMGKPDAGYEWHNPLGYHSLSVPAWVK